MPSVQHASIEERLAIRTPEHVAFAFDVAGIGSRSVAYLADWLIRFTIGALLVFIVFRVGEAGEALPERWRELEALIIMASWLALMWLYTTVFEAAWEGQTPGKRITGIRVVKDDGTPITILDAILRNILRIVDFFPIGYGLGLLVMFFSRQSKRIGDYVAGTVVIKEQAFTLDQYLARDRSAGRAGADERQLDAGTQLPPVLTPAEFEVAAQFLDRREAFEPATRAALAEQLAAPYRGRTELRSIVTQHPDAEALLSALAARGATGSIEAKPAQGPRPRGARLTAPHTLDRFVATRRATWEELAQQCERAAARDLRTFDHRRLAHLGRMYRQASADHALAQTYYPGAAVAQYLNRLVATAHNMIYRRAGWTWRTLLDFYLVEVPATFQAYRRYFWASLAAFLGPAIGAFGLVWVDQAYGGLVVSPGILDSIERQEMWTQDIWLSTPAQLLSFRLFTNNIFVTAMTFTSGVLFGAGTIYYLGMNGFMLGAVTALVLRHDMARPFFDFVTPHGVIELSMIVIGGAGGLILGNCLLSPGRYTRRDAFRVHGRAAVRLMLAAVPVLIMAGWIEGNFSPSPAPFWLKQAFGVSLGVVLYVYLFSHSPRRAERWGPAAATTAPAPSLPRTD